jgi:hypothetical protein
LHICSNWVPKAYPRYDGWRKTAMILARKRSRRGALTGCARNCWAICATGADGAFGDIAYRVICNSAPKCASFFALLLCTAK